MDGKGNIITATADAIVSTEYISRIPISILSLVNLTDGLHYASLGCHVAPRS